MSDTAALNKYWLELLGENPGYSVVIGYDRFHLVDETLWVLGTRLRTPQGFGSSLVNKYEPRAIYSIRGYLQIVRLDLPLPRPPSPVPPITPITPVPGPRFPIFGIDIEARYEHKPSPPNTAPLVTELYDPAPLEVFLPEIYARWDGVPAPPPV